VKNTGWRDARIMYDNQNNDGPMVVDDDEANI